MPPMRPLLTLIILAVLAAGCGYNTPLKLPKPEPGAQGTAAKPPAENATKPAGEP